MFTTLGPTLVVPMLTLAFCSSLHLCPKLHHALHILRVLSRAYSFSHPPSLPQPHQRHSAELDPPLPAPPPSQNISHLPPKGNCPLASLHIRLWPALPMLPISSSAPRLSAWLLPLTRLWGLTKGRAMCQSSWAPPNVKVTFGCTHVALVRRQPQDNLGVLSP